MNLAKQTAWGLVASAVSAGSFLVLAPLIIYEIGLAAASTWFFLDVVLSLVGILDLGVGRLFIQLTAGRRRTRRIASLQGASQFLFLLSGLIIGAGSATFYWFEWGRFSQAWGELTSLAIFVFGLTSGYWMIQRLSAEQQLRLGPFVAKFSALNALSSIFAAVAALLTQNGELVTIAHVFSFAVVTAFFLYRRNLSFEFSRVGYRKLFYWLRISLPYVKASWPSLLLIPLARIFMLVFASKAEFSLFSFALRVGLFINNAFAVLVGNVQASLANRSYGESKQLIVRIVAVVTVFSCVGLLSNYILLPLFEGMLPDELREVVRRGLIPTLIFYGSALVVMETMVRALMARRALNHVLEIRLINLVLSMFLTCVAVMLAPITASTMLLILTVSAILSTTIVSFESKGAL